MTETTATTDRCEVEIPTARKRMTEATLAPHRTRGNMRRRRALYQMGGRIQLGWAHTGYPRGASPPRDRPGPIEKPSRLGLRFLLRNRGPLRPLHLCRRDTE